MYRKELVVEGHRSAEGERLLINLLLSTRPKNPELWAHKEWLLNYNSVPEASFDWIQSEFEFVHRTLKYHYRNYYAWKFRLLLLKKHPESAENELVLVNEWLHSSITDHSALVYKLELLKLHYSVPTFTAELYPENDSVLGVLGREGLWNYRKGLFIAWMGQNLGDALKLMRKESDWISERLYLKKSQFALMYLLWCAIVIRHMSNCRLEQDQQLYDFIVSIRNKVLPSPAYRFIARSFPDIEGSISPRTRSLQGSAEVAELDAEPPL